ncbi:MAG: hypothetical protein LBU81_04365 [Methanosarcinales archaeon]|jgi:hypothetical protein|nr:hypothetical protein [Methanosarcinales archaeon]
MIHSGSFCISLILLLFFICIQPSVADSNFNESLFYSDTLTEFHTAGPANIPRDGTIWYKKSMNDSQISYNYETLVSESDLIFYGTVKTIKSSKWSSKNGKTPFLLYFKYPFQSVYTDENGCEYYYKSVSMAGMNAYISTDVVFEVDEWVKGGQTDEVIITVESGQVGKFIMPGGYANIWDFETNQKFLVFSKEQNGRNEIMTPGLFYV